MGGNPANTVIDVVALELIELTVFEISRVVGVKMMKGGIDFKGNSISKDDQPNSVCFSKVLFLIKL